jgi:uncharacterized membrane protein
VDIRTAARYLLAAFLFVAGTSHFASAEAFLAQVPAWMPWPEAVVAVSGAIELALAVSLVAVPRPVLGWVVAAFFVVVFPGNIAQFAEGNDGFGLDTDLARFVRLLFQPLLVLWALWCTGAWRAWRQRRTAPTE